MLAAPAVKVQIRARPLRLRLQWLPAVPYGSPHYFANFMHHHYRAQPPRTLGLYIHTPWCVRKCPYCDFNSHQARGLIPEASYIDALLADLEQDCQHLNRRTVSSIFIGGGTPSLLSPDAIGRLLERLRERIDLCGNAEITLEANPGTVDQERFTAFRAVGINRLSIGVQSFNDAQLRALGRIHGGAEAARAVESAHQAGFDNINLDLMFGLPGQNAAAAANDVMTAIDLEPTHISYYQLTIEPNTAFYKAPPTLPDDDTIWAIQNSALERLERHGYARYEISACARPGRRCRHNLNYWRFGDYLGIGAGAHGKITTAGGRIMRYWKTKHPQRYLEAAGSKQRIGGVKTVPRHDLAIEFLMNHLRLAEGFGLERLTAKTGLPASDLEPVLSECITDRLLRRQGDTIACTGFGWRHLDDILGRFLPPQPTPHD